ncbi:hypothetical protein Tco_0156812 [Tanacetum coccineum]
MEPDIKNMTMSEYLKYEAAKERKLWDDVRSRRNPTNYNEADVDSFYRNKSKTFSYPYSHNLTPPRTCFLPVQPYPKNYLESTNESNDADIENMTIAEYNLYVSKQGLGMNQPSNHSYGFTAQFFAQPPPTPNTSKKDSDFDKILDDLFRTGAENMKRIGHDIVQDIEDVERIMNFFNVPDEIDKIVQPLIPEPIHTTPPNNDYVAPATKSILDEHLEEFKDEISRSHVEGNVCSLKTLTRLHSSTWATKWFKRLVAYAKCDSDSYERCGARMLNKLQESIPNRSSRMLYRMIKLPEMVDVARRSRLGAWLRA